MKISRVFAVAVLFASTFAVVIFAVSFHLGQKKGQNKAVNQWEGSTVLKSGGKPGDAKGRFKVMAISNNGKWLAAGTDGGNVYAWDLEKQAQIASFVTDPEYKVKAFYNGQPERPPEIFSVVPTVEWLTFSPDSSTLMIGFEVLGGTVVKSSYDFPIKFWGMEKNQEVRIKDSSEFAKYDINVNRLTNVVFHPTKNELIVSYAVNTSPKRVAGYELEKTNWPPGKLLWRWDKEGLMLESLSFSEKGILGITTRDWDSSPYIRRFWALKDGHVVKNFKIDGERFCWLSGNEMAIVTKRHDGQGRQLDPTIEIWNADKEKRIEELKIRFRGNYSVAYSKVNDLLILVGDGRPNVEIWSVAKRKKVAEFTAHLTKFGTEISAAVWTPCGKKFITGGYFDGEVRVWDLETVLKLYAVKE